MYNYDTLYAEIINRVNLEERQTKYLATNSIIERINLLNFFWDEFNYCLENNKLNETFNGQELLLYCINKFSLQLDNKSLDILLLNFTTSIIETQKNQEYIEVIIKESAQKKLTLTKNKIESILLLFRKKDIQPEIISLAKFIFQCLITYNPIKYFKLLLDLVFQTNKASFLGNIPTTNLSHNYINQTDFNGYIKIVVNNSDYKEIIKLINPIYDNIITNLENPFFSNINELLFNLENELKLYSIHNLNSTLNQEKLFEIVNQNKDSILKGHFYIKDNTFSYANSIFENSEILVNDLNFAYNYFNLDFEYFTKYLIKTTTVKASEFNIAIENEFGLNESTFKKRLNIKWLMSKFFDFMLPSFSLNPKFTYQITELYSDFLAINYFKLKILINRNYLTDSILEENISKLEKINNIIQENNLAISTIFDEEINTSESLYFSDFIDRESISKVKLLNRAIDFQNSLSHEKFDILFSTGKKETITIISPIPIRFLNLLAIDIHVFDGIDFTFFERNVDFHLGKLNINLIDNILKSNCDALGLILNTLRDNSIEIDKELRTLEFIDNLSWFNNLVDYNISNEVAEKDKYIDYVLSIPTLKAEDKGFIIDNNLTNNSIHFTTNNDAVNKSELMFNNFTLEYLQHTIALQIHPYFANQFGRLNITPTPNDLEFLWVSNEQKKAISDKNDYRGRLINNEVQLANDARNNSISMRRFCEFIQLSSFSWYEQDFTIIDINNNEIFSVIRSSCPFYPTGNLTDTPTEEVCYFRNKISVIPETIEKLYLFNLIYPNFIKEFNVDLSDLSANGINYFLKLYDFVINDDKEFINDVNFHSLNILHPLYFIEQEILPNPSGQNLINIENELLLNVLSISNNMFLEEKLFLNSYFSPTIQLNKFVGESLRTFYINYKTTMTTKVHELINNFNTNFEPKLNEWNNSFYISITIGIGNSNYGFFSFGNSQIQLPPIPLFKF